MKKAIHHVELNQKLDECFKQLDVITRMYRDFNRDYIEIVENYPNELEEFFEKFERNCSQCFKLFDEGKREEIKQLFEKETAERQQKLEDEAMIKYEEEKKKEEQKLKEDEEKNPKGGKKAPAKAPPKKGKEPDKPDLGVPQLQVPEIQEFISVNGYKYLIQRTTEEIATELMLVKTEESDKDEQEEEGEDKEPQIKPPIQEKVSQPPVDEAEKEGEGEKQEEPEKEEINEYLERAKKIPPEDPDGTKVLEEDLIIKHHEIKSLVDNFFQKMFNWISSVKEDSFKKMKVNNKELIDSNIDELDENLRKQWPRKGKLEVEVYQERKSQITAHNKKYERQVRQCLERHNKSEEMWVYLIDNINREFENYFKQQEKLKGNITECKNLAELQGNSRKERDSVQSFEEKITEITDKLYDIAVAQSDSLIKLNNDMLKSCQLFEQGGNYSELEVEWYKTQMDEINEMLQSFRKEKEQELADVNDRLQRALKDPYDEFENNYKSGMHKLVTKEGLGKKYGAPRRIIQEKMRAEMTKCEQAQSGIEKLLEKLSQLCSGDWVGDQATTSLSIEIRKVQICIMR